MTCEEDCPHECGDEVCSGDETADSCPGDCGSECGDGFCTHDEDASTCPQDCTECGDGLCTGEANFVCFWTYAGNKAAFNCCVSQREAACAIGTDKWNVPTCD